MTGRRILVSLNYSKYCALTSAPPANTLNRYKKEKPEQTAIFTGVGPDITLAGYPSVQNVPNPELESVVSDLAFYSCSNFSCFSFERDN